MEKVGSVFNRKWQKSDILYALYILTFVLFTYLVSVKFGDDAYWQNEFAGTSIVKEVMTRYQTWSSRVVIDYVMIFLASHRLMYWKIINVLVFATLPHFCIRLFDLSERGKAYLILLLGMYPMLDMASCGWVAATTNYIWPLWCLVYIAQVIRKAALQRKVSPWEWVLSVFAMLYGGCHELMAVFLLLVFFFYAWRILYEKKERVHPMVVVLFAMNVLLIAMVLISPGNALRTAAETTLHFPAFATFGPFQKLYIGIYNLMRVEIFHINALFYAFMVMLTILVFLRTKNWKKVSVTMVPSGIALSYMLSPLFVQESHVDYSGSFFTVFRQPLGPMTELSYDFAHVLCIIYFLLFVLCVCLALVWICEGDKTTALFCILIFGMGLATAVVMGFSPTVYESVRRPYIYFNFTMIFLSIFCYNAVLGGTLIDNEADRISKKMAGDPISDNAVGDSRESNEGSADRIGFIILLTLFIENAAATITLGTYQ